MDWLLEVGSTETQEFLVSFQTVYSNQRAELLRGNRI